ncbi:LOW QUALITY PROTEIN: centrosomal protein of 72 kDa [Lagenorhynchus albirostris]|uniref:LOW QUALITY PROTEIN: centrosomal protein of 72 kDa n=1 Tax=Lagenorhynchus albirostris TaxID=27610 RepID=UPI0028EE9DDF|nr:LOW QUALITY PROTEIN: centrosomal protein of 72 kDa [Lagenorhynchus albirostris]
MAPAGRLVLCEEKIWGKTGLAPHRGLAQLRSLSIPGTYQEKITHLGNSLMNLIGLNSLDLSRNSLVSLEGMEYLAALQRLSVYHIRISSLAEVFRLHCLTELAEVDFRLHPVVESKSDYRLFVVRMLPRLRPLDDRPVRESERRASRLHLASEESLDSKQSFPAVFRVERYEQDQVSCPLGQEVLVMDADDEAALNLIAECGWGLSSPPGSTSSSQQEQEASFPRSKVESRHLLSPELAQQQRGDPRRKGPEKRRGSSSGAGRSRGCRAAQEAKGAWQDAPGPCRPGVSELLGGGPELGPCSRSAAWGPEQQRPHSVRELSQVLAQSRPESPRAVVDGASSPLSLAQLEMETFSKFGARVKTTQQTVCPKLHLAVPPGKKATLEVALLDLVGRHCSGCSPLHGSEVFLAQARHILSSVQEFTATQDSSTTVSEEISSLTMENKSLQSRLAELQQQYSVKMSEVVLELSDTRKEMDHLRQHLGRTLEESSSLKSLLFSVKKEVRNADAPSTLNLQITGFQTSVKRLSGEIVELKQRLEHYNRIQELTQMLQESRRYLVSTNEHLLRELGQVRAQHEAEVEPRHWGHRELKKPRPCAPAPARVRALSAPLCGCLSSGPVVQPGGGLECPKKTGSSKPLTCLETNRSVVFHQIS